MTADVLHHETSAALGRRPTATRAREIDTR